MSGGAGRCGGARGAQERRAGKGMMGRERSRPAGCVFFPLAGVCWRGRYTCVPLCFCIRSFRRLVVGQTAAVCRGWGACTAEEGSAQLPRGPATPSRLFNVPLAEAVWLRSSSQPLRWGFRGRWPPPEWAATTGRHPGVSPRGPQAPSPSTLRRITKGTLGEHGHGRGGVEAGRKDGRGVRRPQPRAPSPPHPPNLML